MSLHETIKDLFHLIRARHQLSVAGSESMITNGRNFRTAEANGFREIDSAAESTFLLCSNASDPRLRFGTAIVRRRCSLTGAFNGRGSRGVFARLLRTSRSSIAVATFRLAERIETSKDVIEVFDIDLSISAESRPGDDKTATSIDTDLGIGGEFASRCVRLSTDVGARVHTQRSWLSSLLPHSPCGARRILGSTAHATAKLTLDLLLKTRLRPLLNLGACALLHLRLCSLLNLRLRSLLHLRLRSLLNLRLGTLLGALLGCGLTAGGGFVEKISSLAVAGRGEMAGDHGGECEANGTMHHANSF